MIFLTLAGLLAYVLVHTSLWGSDEQTISTTDHQALVGRLAATAATPALAHEGLTAPTLLVGPRLRLPVTAYADRASAVSPLISQNLAAGVQLGAYPGERGVLVLAFGGDHRDPLVGLALNDPLLVMSRSGETYRYIVTRCAAGAGIRCRVEGDLSTWLAAQLQPGRAASQAADLTLVRLSRGDDGSMGAADFISATWAGPARTATAPTLRLSENRRTGSSR